jgi:hypothetical protein
MLPGIRADFFREDVVRAALGAEFEVERAAMMASVHIQTDNP